MPPVVFVTAFDEHAVKAFDVHAFDYLLKPVDNERFAAAMDRARKMKNDRTMAMKLDALLAHVGQAPSYLERIMVKHPGRMTFIPVDEVEWIEAEGDYVYIHLEGKRVLIREKIGDLERNLNPRDFVRIHRSSIVCIAMIKELQPTTSGEYHVILKNGNTLTLSRTYRERVLAGLNFRL
jgi:two-component system LytT family response regulator